MPKSIYWKSKSWRDKDTEGHFVIETFDWEGEKYQRKKVNVVKLDEPIIGQKVYCTSYSLKSVTDRFIKDQVYVIEKVSKGKTTAGRVKFVGVKDYHDLANFSPIENNQALYREAQMSELMGDGIFSSEKIRRIDIMPNRNRVLIQMFIASFQSQIGIEGERSNSKVTYDEIIKNLIKKYPKFELTEQDYENIAGLTIKELVDSFVKEVNID
jgi:hypothetical protein